MNFEALPYHTAVTSHLNDTESELWRWFQSDKFSDKYVDDMKLELLKSTYRLSRDDHASIYALADTAAKRLGLDLPLTVYQGQGGTGDPNAALIYFPDEIAIMLMGGIRDLMVDEELLALFGHEIAHHKLYSEDNGRFFTATRMLEWCAGQHAANDAYAETRRLFQLYTEIYADMGGLLATEQNRDAVVSCLVKVSTGLKDVSAAAYLDQADEILAQIHKGSEGITHPETYIRAKTLDLISADPPKLEELPALVEGPLEVQRLDVLGQKKVSDITRTVINCLCSQSFMRTEHTTNLVQRFFPEDTSYDTWTSEKMEAGVPGLAETVTELGASSREYLAYVLLDFATVDPDHEDIALAWCLAFADRIKLHATFEPIARKQLRRKKDALAKMMRRAPDMIEKANDG